MNVIIKKYKKTYSKVAARAQEMYYKQMFDSKTNTIKKALGKFKYCLFL